MNNNIEHNIINVIRKYNIKRKLYKRKVHKMRLEGGGEDTEESSEKAEKDVERMYLGYRVKSKGNHKGNSNGSCNCINRTQNRLIQPYRGRNCWYMNNRIIHNFSSCNFTEQETEILSLGLKFKIPTITAHSDLVILNSFTNYINTLRQVKLDLVTNNTFYSVNKSLCQTLRKYINKQHNYKAKNKSIEPINSMYGIPIESYITKCKERVKNTLTQHTVKRYRYNKQEHKKILSIYRQVEQLKHNRSIVIKPTDKNLGIAIIDLSEYVEAGYSKLDSRNYLRQQDVSYDKIAKNLIMRFIKLDIMQVKTNTADINYTLPMDWGQFTFNQYFSEALHLIMYYFSHPDLIVLCRYYVIPKAHKNPRGWREICANPRWITSIGSYTAHTLLMPIVEELPSYIKSSNELIIELNKIECNNECAFLQADIESMYPSINIQDGILVLEHVLRGWEYPTNIQEFIKEITEWVLIHNYMTFNNRIYLQINGTAMGTSLSVAFSCLYVGYKENIAIQQFKNMGLPDPLIYKRLIDDTMAIFHDKYTAAIYMEILKTCIGEGLTLEYNIDTDSCTFLDVKLYKNDTFRNHNKIATTLYQKLMNKYLFLPPTSAHSISIFRAWITSYITRIRIICSDDIEFIIHKDNFYNRLRDRGYTRKFLKKIIDREYN